ncbi:MAG: hypothetical protein IPK04_20070 [Bdellovibrionales bacterium]|nr:hypothetical protein [Bdellovibrionales bacterium]
MERLAALIPRPKIHLTRYHGVLAPHYKFRKQIVPAGSKAKIDSLKSRASNDKKKPRKEVKPNPMGQPPEAGFRYRYHYLPKMPWKSPNHQRH